MDSEKCPTTREVRPQDRASICKCSYLTARTNLSRVHCGSHRRHEGLYLLYGGHGVRAFRVERGSERIAISSCLPCCESWTEEGLDWFSSGRPTTATFHTRQI